MSQHEASASKREAATMECAPLDSGSCSKGIYVMDKQLVAITKLKGKLLHRMGIQRGDTLYLRLEEAMYLMERDLLIVEIPSVKHAAAASMTELKHLMEIAGIALHDYAVYRELMNASLVVTRHPAQWLDSKINQERPVERPANQNSIEEQPPLPCKRQKLDQSIASAGTAPAETGSAKPKQSPWWPTVEPMPQSSHGREEFVQGAEASSSSVGEWRTPDRPRLQPFRRCPPAPDSRMTLNQPTLAYDVYGANSSFSRRQPSGLLMRVHMSQSRPPSRVSMCAAEAACQGNEAMYHATAAGNHVSMYNFQPVCLPDLLWDDSSEQKK